MANEKTQFGLDDLRREEIEQDILKLNQSSGPVHQGPEILPPSTTDTKKGELGFAGEVGEPGEPTFTDLFLNKMQIVRGEPGPGEVSFEDIEKAGGIGAIQAGERFVTPGIRETNEVLSTLLGETTGTQRASPIREELSGWQKGLLFVSDIIAVSQGRMMPSLQLRGQLGQSITLQDRMNQEKFLKGIEAFNGFSEMVGKIDNTEDRMRAAIPMVARMRRTFGEGFGTILIAQASKPSRQEAWEAFQNNIDIYEDSASDIFMKYTAFLFGSGQTEAGQKAFLEYGLVGKGGEPGVFERDALYQAPALLENKLEGFAGELRALGGKYAELATKIDGEEGRISPGELINANAALPANSNFRLDKSVVRTLSTNPELFAAILPNMVTAAQQQEYQSLLNKSELSMPVNFISGLGNVNAGEIVTAPGTSQKAMWLQNNGYHVLDSAMTKLGGGSSRPSDEVIRGFGNDFMKESAHFVKLDNSYNAVLGSSRHDNAPGHIAAIFAFMKILDPESVVREGEQATAHGARSLPDALVTYYDRLVTGKKLTDTQVEQFREVAEEIWGLAAHGQADREARWRTKMYHWKIPAELVIQDLIGKNRSRFDAPRVKATDEDVKTLQKELNKTLGRRATAAEVRQALLEKFEL